MNRLFIKKHLVSVSVLLFIFSYIVVLYFLKPGFIYDDDGSFRQFGIGCKKKSVVNIMIVTIILSIISYFGVLYYLEYPSIVY
jgi:hypothetical protein